MDPSSIVMVIKAPEALLLFLKGPGQNGVLEDCSRLEGSLGVQVSTK